MAELGMRPDLVILLAIVAIVTYFTRSGGYLILSRFARIPPRLEAALNAVPAAVITALVIPPAINGGAPELAAIGVAGVAALRLPAIAVLAAGMATLIAMRAAGL